MAAVADEGALYERELELERITALLDAVEAGSGASVAVDGPAGIGKTALLAAAAALGHDRGHTVLCATGAEQERDFAYGVMRQLLEPPIAGRSETERATLLSGAAAMAAPVVDPAGDRWAQAPGGEAATLHGIYWLIARLAAAGPLIVLVDDLQWSDPASLRGLAYVGRRLTGLRLLLVVATRSGEPDVGPGSTVPITDGNHLGLSPLSEAATARVLADVLDRGVDGRVARACHTAAAGNPFFVRELSRTLARAAARGEDVLAAIERVTPETVGRAVRERLAQLPRPARELAGAIAVIGPRARLRTAARLAGLDHLEAASAADALEAAGIVGTRPLGFAHPIVRTAVYGSLPAQRRALEHGRVGRLLAAEGADAVEVASHLMAAEPLADPDVVRWLRAAAHRTLRAGAPAEAAGYLRRALDEPAGPELTPALLHELGGAELQAREPGAEAHLRDALRRGRNPGERAHTAVLLAEAVGFGGRVAEARDISSAALADLDGRDRPLALRLETQRARNDAIDARQATRLDARLPELLALAEAGGAAGRELQLCLALRLALRGEPTPSVLSLVERGLDDGRLVAQEGGDSAGAVTAVVALAHVDRLEAADALLVHMAADARGRGSVMGLMAVDGWRAYVQHRRGDLAGAETSGRAALALAEEHAQHFPAGYARTQLAQTRIDQGADEEAAQLLAVAVPGELQATTMAAGALEHRGRLALARGDRRAAATALRACGVLCDQLAIANPGAFPWRTLLARCLAPDARAEALALVAADLQAARHGGRARDVGTVLRASARLAEGAPRLELLREAIAELERSPARVEHARALVDLGVALRHAGHAVRAREPLRFALDLAEACGARPLIEQARAELRIAGARPRHRRLTGVHALTASEARVAGLARQGLSNPEIADAVFVSRKTVEKHLSGAYRKLGIDSRVALGEALRGHGHPPATTSKE